MSNLGQPPPLMLLRIGLLLLAITAAICHGFRSEQPMYVSSSLRGNFTGWYHGEGQLRSKRDIKYAAQPISAQQAPAYFSLNRIEPQNGEQLIFDSSYLSEEYLNRICGNAWYMKACIVIRGSTYKALRCPYLQQVESCSPGRPFLEVIDNPSFQDLYLPTGLKYPTMGTPVVIQLNPLIPTLALSPISNACPGCRVTEDISCGLMDREFSQIELVTACAGKEIIRPAHGFELLLDSATVSEEQLNAMCSNAIYMEICITISESQFRSLRCPKLQYLVSCRPDRPAITVINNQKLVELVFPPNVRFGKSGYPFQLENNPMIGAEMIKPLKILCPNCIIIPGNANKMKLSYQQWFGSVRIEPQLGSMLVFDSSDIPEGDMNKIFESVVSMKACIIISNSDYTYFRAPNLRYVESCAPDRPAIMLFNNAILRKFYIPPDITFGPSQTAPVLLQINPLLPTSTLTTLAVHCHDCDVLRDIACGSWNKPATGAELVRLCAGAALIKPAPGTILQVNSSEVTELDLTRLCSNAVYMKICITIYKSQFRSLRCPRLKVLEPCEPGRAAIVVIENPYLIEFYIPPDVRMVPGTLHFETNPLLPIWVLPWLPQDHPTLTSDSVCGLGTRPYTIQEFVRACAGKKMIIPPPGGMIELDATFISEHDLNLLCSEVVHMEICITITHSNFQKLSCPKLQVLRSCSPDRPAITVKDNPLFVQIEIPDSVDLSTYGIPFFIINNPALPKDTLYLLRKRYPNSIFIMVDEIVHVEEVKEWIGNETLPPESLIKKGIYPTVPTAPPVYPWTEPAEPRVRGRPGPFTPPSVNGIPTLPPGSESFIYPTAPTAPPVYPWTEPAEPRVRGRPGPFTPPSVDGKPTLPPGSESFTYPTPPTPVYPWTAPARPGGQGMPGPFTTPSSVFVPYTTPPAMPGPTPPSPDHDRGTNLDPRHPRPREGPDGFRPIPLPGPEGYGPTPSPGGVPFLDPERPLILDAYVISESIMNMVLENVVYLKACIIVMNSNYTRLRLPRLQRLESCDPNRPAIYLFNNLYLVEFYLPPNVIYPNYGVPVIVQLNPLLPLIQLVRYQEQCPNCRFIDDVGCGMGYRSYTELEFVQKCKGSAIIKPALPEFKIEIHSDTVDQVMMYELCKNAIYMEICITIRKSTIKSLRCPKLRMLKPCEPGRAAITIIENDWFEDLLIPSTVQFDPKEAPFHIELNPHLPATILFSLQLLCPHCRLTNDIACGLSKRSYTAEELVRACAGAQIIRPVPGYTLVIDSRTATEAQINALCSEAVYMEICLVISQSNFRSLRCPKLRTLKPCRPDEPAIKIVDNPEFVYLEIAEYCVFPTTGTPVQIENNPKLNESVLRPIQDRCRNCITGTAEELVNEETARYYVGKRRIEPPPGKMLILHSSRLPEQVMNMICENAVYMKVCIIITNSNYKSLRCPNLRELDPCRPDRPALKIFKNLALTDVYIPPTCSYPSTGAPIIMEINPLLPPDVLKAYFKWCPRCAVTPDIACGVDSQKMSLGDIITNCARKSVIRPAPGSLLELDASELTQKQLDDLCANAVYMEICLTIKQTQLRSLRCPVLRMLVPCEEGRPAITIVNNTQFENIYIPMDTQFPPKGVTIHVELNPLIPTPVLLQLQQACPQCQLLDDIGCGLGRGHRSMNEILQACVGKRIIRPATGYMIEIDSVVATEDQLNRLCAEAVYMEICIRITTSNIQSLRCPHLQVLKSCKPDTPAIIIEDNPMFRELVIPPNVVLQPDVVPIVLINNPMLPKDTLEGLRRICPKCLLTTNVELVTPESARKWFGKERIEPPRGVSLVFDSALLSQDEMNRICENAVYMKACIVVTNSTYQVLRCPYLKTLHSCSLDRPAITLYNNIFLHEFYLPPDCELPLEGMPLVLEVNPLLQPDVLEAIAVRCPRCRVSLDIACGLGTRQYSTEELVAACMNKAVIKPAPGYSLYLDAWRISEVQMNAICSKAIYIEACITIEKSTYKSLNCPVLKRLVSCNKARPAIVITENDHLEQFYMPLDVELPHQDVPIYIKLNPLLPTPYLLQLQARCPHCHIAYDIACGLAGQWTRSNIKQLVSACVGKKIIRPEYGNMIVFNSDEITEDEINAVCANARYMEACIYIHESAFEYLRCPKLEVLKPCRPDLPAINIINNSQFREFVLPDKLTHPSVGAPVTIRGNPALSPRLLHPIRKKCPNCITDGVNDVLVTERNAQYFYGKQQIVPPKGKALVFDSSVLSEYTMNQICAEARYIEACIIIANSQYTGLRCPHLQKMKSCSPDRPAIRLFNNRYLSEFKVPCNMTFENYGTPIIADINPLLTAQDLMELQEICPQCKVTADILCGLDNRKKHSPQEIAQACAGKAVIKPYPGEMLLFDSSVVTEAQMNAMAANAIYMHACITIKKSSYRQLVLPNLLYLKPCKEGRPAIDIIDNHEFSYFYLAENCNFRTTSSPMHFEMNPRLPTMMLENILSACPSCNTISDIACGLGNREYTLDEFVNACESKAVIKPRSSQLLILHSDYVTEKQMNRLCKNAVYMEVCINISNSRYTSLKCPKLQDLVPCQPGRSVLVIENNPNFSELMLPALINFPQSESSVVVRKNNRLNPSHLQRLKRICPKCTLLP